MDDHGFIRLYTDRLLLRDHLPEDAATHHEMLSDPLSMRYLPDIMTHSYEESLDNLRAAIAAVGPGRKEYFLRIELKDTGEHVGEIGYTVTERTPFGYLAGLGYFSRKKFWGRGYVSEAARAVLDFAFREGGVFRMSTGCLAENVGSERVMQKCGMIREAHFVQFTCHEGQMKDRLEYRLLREEYLALQAARV